MQHYNIYITDSASLSAGIHMYVYIYITTIQKWSTELASVAQKYAEECKFSHNTHHSNQTYQFSYVGENIAVTNNPVVNYSDLVYGWYNENQFYDIASRECMGGECRHYTQVYTCRNTIII